MRWLVAMASSLASFLLIALSTDLIDNPVFGRSIAPTDWAMETAILTAVLGGLLTATYVKDSSYIADERSAKLGGLGGLAAYFAVGCPVCNKLVVIALGTAGAVTWFAPMQPYLAGGGVLLLAYALRRRLTAESSCSIQYSKMES